MRRRPVRPRAGDAAALAGVIRGLVFALIVDDLAGGRCRTPRHGPGGAEFARLVFPNGG